jgi:hypothetical protein
MRLSVISLSVILHSHCTHVASSCLGTGRQTKPKVQVETILRSIFETFSKLLFTTS